jgi:hypothetical protein
LQPHLLNSTFLKEQMYYNFNFALSKNLPVDSFYAVSPHHSGIYPIYDALYKHWSDVWNIKATSTEGYPHLRPSYLRKGFIHNGIMVLPRQTCGIFTHTIFIKDYPNGIERLNSMVDGGEIFKTVLLNPVLIFMTHMTNYANDRLALYVFRRLLNYINEWTNLELNYLKPIELAKKYFQLNPSDAEPLWTNICSDKRHLNKWSLNSTYCSYFPQIIIVGPQKTGISILILL